MPKSSVVSLFDRPRWSVEDARAVLAALDQSGQSVSVFAAEHGLDPQRVYVWRRRLGVGAEATMFREIAVQRTPRTPPATAPFEVEWASGVRVRVPASFDESMLICLLGALAQADVC